MEKQTKTVPRNAEFAVESIFLERWSPRAMSGQSISKDELHTLFEAARWAPSTYNEQEWRFLYAPHESSHWNAFFDFLVEGNKEWCKNAAVLSVILAHKVFERNGKPNQVHLFDCGCAFENLALQGTAMGLVVHGMMGFDYEKARTVLRVPEDYAVVAMFAIGKPGNVANLPENLRERELPSGRKPVSEIICEGPFAFPNRSTK